MASRARSMLELNVSMRVSGKEMYTVQDRRYGEQQTKGREMQDVRKAAEWIYSRGSPNLQQKELLKADQVLTSAARGKYSCLKRLVWRRNVMLGYRFLNANFQTYERSCLPWNLMGTCGKHPQALATKSVLME